MSEKLTIHNLIEWLAERHGMSNRNAESFVKEFFSVIKDSLAKEKYVKVKGLGTFRLIGTEGCESVDVNMEEDRDREGYTKVSFIPDPALKKAINRPFAHFNAVPLSNECWLDDASLNSGGESPAEQPAPEPVTQETPAEEPDVKRLIEELVEEVPVDNPTEKEEEETPADESAEEEQQEASTEKNDEVALIAETPAEEPQEEASSIENETENEQPDIISLADNNEVKPDDEPEMNEDSESESESESKPDSVSESELGLLVPALPEEEGGTLSETVVPADSSHATTMRFFIGIVALAVMLCLAAIICIQNPDLLDNREKDPHEPDPIAEAQAEYDKAKAKEREKYNAMFDSLLATRDSMLTRSRDDASESLLASSQSEAGKRQETAEGQTAARQTTGKDLPKEKDLPQERVKGTPVVAPKVISAVAAKAPFTADSTSCTIVGTETSYVIQSGETLTRVSLRFYGTKALYPYIVKHNPGVIKNPNNVPSGTRIRIPKLVRNE